MNSEFTGQVRAVQQEMVNLLEKLAPVEGYNLSLVPDVRFLRSNRPLKRMPVLYDPGIVIVCQGTKRGYFGDRVYVYDAQHFLAVALPVPFTMETQPARSSPYWRFICILISPLRQN